MKQEDSFFQGKQKASVKTITSRELFGDGSELLIQHASGLYKLMITKTGKLILNK